MEQNSQNQNKNEGLFQKNQIFIAVGVVIVLAAIIFFTTRGENKETADNSDDDQDTEQVSGDNVSDDQNSNSGSRSDANSSSLGQVSGNINATGTLKTSDDLVKGNLMVISNRGKLYIATNRDFSSLVNQEVSLNAEGTLDKFTFLGLNTAADMGGAPDSDQTPTAPANSDVIFAGKLQVSDNNAKGNYVIVSGTTTVYLKTAHDYSDWTGSDVILTATGTLENFTQAKLAKK